MMCQEYVFYLVFGGLFGAEGGWPMARVLADRAIAAIPHASEQSDAPGEKISGREAYYLRAIAGRLTARSESALDEAEEHLVLAYEALAQEHRDNPRPHGNDRALRCRDDRRFRISRSLFRRFRTHAKDWRQPLVDWRVDISARLERVDAELKDVTLRERVRVALETNYLLCLILTSAEHPSEAPSTREDLHLRDRGMLEDLSRRGEQRGRPRHGSDLSRAGRVARRAHRAGATGQEGRAARPPRADCGALQRDRD